MNTAKHSPLPWEIDRNAKLSDSDGEFVAFLASAVCRNPDGHTDEQGEANAALIVKSVNLHDELVAALTEVAFDAQYPDHKIGAETLRRIEELLKKARQ